VTPGAVLGIDPGVRKCGLAVVAAGGAAERAIVPTPDVAGRVRELAARMPIRVIALGGGTHTAAVASVLAALGIPVRVVDEYETTILARRRYFDANPPRGWRRLVPRGMLLPPGPIDDFAAQLIAERYLAAEAEQGEAAGGPPPG
jgi:RNase H-fold protein (predicted Holliday junction resolvase)